MRVLAIVQQADAGPGVFADAAAARGDELDEWLIAEGRRPPGRPARLRRGDGPRRRDERRRGGRAPLAGGQKALLRDLLARRIPLLGVCLGAQLVAEAAGRGRAGRRGRRSAGTRSSCTAAGARTRCSARLPRLQRLPVAQLRVQPLARGAVLAAQPGLPSGLPARRRRLGIQFHAEVSERRRAEWIDDYDADPDAVAIGLDPEALAAESSARIGAWNELGRGSATASSLAPRAGPV